MIKKHSTIILTCSRCGTKNEYYEGMSKLFIQCCCECGQKISPGNSAATALKIKGKNLNENKKL